MFLITAFLLKDFLAFFLHFIMGWLRLTGNSGGVLVSPCSSSTIYSRLPRALSECVLNISNGDSATSLGSLCCASVWLPSRHESVPCCSQGASCVSALLLWSCRWALLKVAWLCPFPSGTETCWWGTTALPGFFLWVQPLGVVRAVVLQAKSIYMSLLAFEKEVD